MDCWTSQNYVYRARHTLFPFSLFVDYVLEKGGFQGKTFVDLGCGQGRIGQFICLMGARHTELIDISINGINSSVWATMADTPFGSDNGLHFSQSSIVDYSSSSDFFFCADVMEHLYQTEVLAAFENIKKQINIGGLFYISCKSDMFEGEEQHKTIKPVEWWKAFIEEHFTIVKGYGYVENEKAHSCMLIVEKKGE